MLTKNTPQINSLDIFDDPVTKSLKKEVDKLGHNPSALRPLIKTAVDEAKKEISEGREESILLPRILRERILNTALSYIVDSLKQSGTWESIQDQIEAYSSIFLVGAGISFESGIPLTTTLNELLDFCNAKDYEELRNNKEKCFKFKEEFRKICSNKEVGTSHKLIADNFPQHILEIVCLNWDNLIERADRDKFKEKKVTEDTPVNGEHFLWKFHGDVSKIKKDKKRGEKWVFPDEEGYVFDCFLDYIEGTGLKEEMLTFVIVGYSEGEKEIYDKVIKPFEEERDRPVYRIGLNLSNLHCESYIVGPSSFILSKIMP